jgi:glyoxylase-like metal-dependent hydrolase (beta-lactamase superfamily II)
MAHDQTYRIGAAEVTRIVDLELRNFTPAQLFPDGWTPETLTRHPEWFPAPAMDQERKHLLMSIHSWLIKESGRMTLIDTATGNDKGRPYAPYFNHLKTPYLDRLAAAGVQPEDVNLVLITHVHVDHVGWNTRLKDGLWKPTFPNARYVFSRAEHQFFTDPVNLNDRTRTSFAAQTDSVDPVIAAGLADQVNIDGAVPAPGFRFQSTPGHSPHHASIIFESEQQTALFPGDVMHHPIQVYEPAWNAVFDAEPDLARRSRAWALNFAVAKNARVFSSHFPGSSTGYIRAAHNGYEWKAQD